MKSQQREQEMPAGKRTVIPFKLVGNKIYLSVSVNGRKPSSFVLDTGAPCWVIDADHARTLKLPLNDEMEIQAMGAAGSATSTIYQLSDLTMGLAEYQLQRQTAITLPMPNVKLGYPHIQGIVGGDFIGRFVIEFDFINEIMTLHDPASYEYQGDGALIPIQLNGGHPYMQVQVTPFEQSPIQANFALDTGANTTVAFNTPFVNKHQLLNSSQKRIRSILGYGVGGPVLGHVSRIQTCQLGPIEIENPTATFANTKQGAHAMTEFAGVIGMEIMRRFHMVLDYPGKRIILEKNVNFDTPYEHDMSGMMLSCPGDTFHVDMAVDGGPAVAAGLRQGDLITHVNGRSVQSINLSNLRSSFKEAGKTFQFIIQRKDETIEAILTLRRLV